MNIKLDLQPQTSIILRFLIAIAYTTLLLTTLLQSSQFPVVGPAMPPGPVPLEREIVLTLAHFTGFGLLTVFWWWALNAIMPFSRALIVACVFAFCLGMITEYLQTFVPDRGASWWDVATNTTAIAVSASMIFRRYGRETD